MSSEQASVAERVRNILAKFLTRVAEIDYAFEEEYKRRDRKKDPAVKPKSFRLYRPPRPQMPEEKRITPDQITDDRPWDQDLESMEDIEFLLEIENEFHCKIPQEYLDKIHTVGDMIRYLEKKEKQAAKE